MLSFLKRKDLYFALTRYALSVPMMGFGIMKIQGMQFNNILPLSTWQVPLERLAGYQLTWAFLGYSSWLQIVLGILEFVPAFFLLFRRTALVAATLLLPMTMSVFLINYALHLWSDTRLLALILLLLNLLVFLFEWEKLSAIFKIALHSGGKNKYRLAEILIALALVSIPLYRKLHADYGRSDNNVLTGDWFHKHPNEFTLVAEKLNGRTLSHPAVRAYFGRRGTYSEIKEGVSSIDGSLICAINEKEHRLDIYPPQNKSQSSFYYMVGHYQYEMSGDTILSLQSQINDSVTHTWEFKKRVMNPNQIY